MLERIKTQIRAINEIFKTNSRRDWFIQFDDNLALLKDWRLLFTEQSGNSTIPEIIHNKIIAGKAYLCNIFAGNRLFVLDYDILTDMKRDACSMFGIDYSVSLDTQVVSYLKKYIWDNGNKVPDEFVSLITYIVDNNINFDPMEYLYENMKEVISCNEELIQSLQAYFILKDIDTDVFKNTRKIVPRLPLEQLEIKAKKEFEQMKLLFANPEVRKYIYDTYQLAYVLLLKIVLIQIEHHDMKKEDKLKILLEFMQEKIGYLCLREYIIANAYFEKGQKMGFFSEIQKGSTKNLKNLQNMAWDLFHVRQLERNHFVIGEKGLCYIPAFITFDKGLSEIIKLCSISKIAYNHKKGITIPVYDIIEKQSIDGFNDYFSYEYQNKQSELSNIDSLIIKLEAELNKF